MKKGNDFSFEFAVGFLSGAVGEFLGDQVEKYGTNAIKKGLNKLKDKLGSSGSKIDDIAKKLGISLDDVVDTSNSVDLNKLNHIFGKEQHNLSSFLKHFKGNEEKAFSALLKETTKYVKANNITGTFTDIVVKVAGFKITVRGAVVNGIVRIGTVFIP